MDQSIEAEGINPHAPFPPSMQAIEIAPKPWGHEEIWAQGLGYAAKTLHIKAGCRLSLQYHDQKRETLRLKEGRAYLHLDNPAGELVKIEMQLDQAYVINLFQRHRLEAITDCQILEASTPESGNTKRLQDDYSRPTETEEMRARPGRV